MEIMLTLEGARSPTADHDHDHGRHGHQASLDDGLDFVNTL